MADTKLTALTALTTPTGADLIYIVDDVAGTPTSKKITLTSFFAGIDTATKIDVNSATALVVEQDGVKDNTLVVDTTNGRVSVAEDGTTYVPFTVDGYGAFGSSVATVGGAGGTGDGYLDRALMLVDPQAVMKIWRYTNTIANAPAIELIWGAQTPDTHASNVYWDIFVYGDDAGFYIRDRTGGNNNRLHIDSSGSIFIGPVTTNANMTLGLTIDQDDNDDEAFALKSSDVAQPATDNAEEDTFFAITKAAATAGGATLAGYRDSGGASYRALVLTGILGEAANTTKASNIRGVVDINAAVTDGGTGVASVAANGNVFSISNNDVTLQIVDAEGTTHYITGDNDLDIIMLSATTEVPTLWWDDSQTALTFSVTDTFGHIIINRADTTISNNSNLGKIQFSGDDAASTNHVAASINAKTTEGWSSGNNGTKLAFNVTENGTDTLVNALSLLGDLEAQFAGIVNATAEGLRTKVSTANVSDPPTDAELDSAFGTPAALGEGFIGILDDNSADTDVWLCYTSDTSWYYLQGTKAV